MMTEYTFYNDGNNLILEGDFGYMLYNDETYFSSEILFFSPSQHTFTGKRLPMEMQIVHRNSLGDLLKISVLFRYSEKDYSLFLEHLNFDRVELQDQEPFKPLHITEDINISKYIHNGKDFFIYDGMEDTPPCQKKAKYLILTDVLKVSRKQLYNFPKIVSNKHRDIQVKRDRKIYTNFKMKEIQEKLDENKKRVEELMKQKVEMERLKNIAAKLNEQQNLLTRVNTTEIFNNTSNITINNSSLGINNNTSLNHTTQEDCDKRNIIPFEDVQAKVNAYEKIIKGNDLKLIGSLSDDKESLIIDKDIPKTLSEIKREMIEKKYLQWKKIFEQTSKGSDKTKIQLLIQMKSLERELKENNIDPLMRMKDEIVKDKISNSFLQISNRNNEFSEIGLEILNSNLDDKMTRDWVDSLIRQFSHHEKNNKV